jgi:hypothetical protein
MNETNRNPEAAALKADLLASLHCALPGIVESFDPETQTAVVRPAVKGKTGLAYPLLRDVPVFFPGGRESALAFPVSPGDECLAVFSDAATDEWFASGEPSAPASGRRHDLSDAFAFVGFRSRAHALRDFPEEPAFFGAPPGGGISEEELREQLQEALAGKANLEHTHDAAEIVSGILPVANGGSGQSGTSATATVAEVATAASGCSITTAQYVSWGKTAQVRLVIKKSAAVSSGTTTLATMVSGKRPRYTASLQWGWNKQGQITSAGAVQVNGAISAGESLTLLSTFVLA